MLSNFPDDSELTYIFHFIVTAVFLTTLSITITFGCAKKRQPSRPRINLAKKTLDQSSKELENDDSDTSSMFECCNDAELSEKFIDENNESDQRLAIKV